MAFEDDTLVPEEAAPTGQYIPRKKKLPVQDKYKLQQQELVEGDGNARTSTNYRRGARSAAQAGQATQFNDLMPDNPYRNIGIQDKTVAGWDRQDQYIEDVENAFIFGQQFGVPLGWLAVQQPEDMVLMGGEELMPDLAMTEEDIASARIRGAELRAGIEAEADRQLAARETGRDVWQSIGMAAGTMLTGNPDLFGSVRESVEVESPVFGVPTEREALIAQLELELISNPIVEEPSQFTQDRRAVVGWLGEQLGNAMNQIGGEVIRIGQVMDASAEGYALEQFEAEQAAQIAEIQQTIDTTEQARWQKARQIAGPAAADYLIANGDPMVRDFQFMAMGPTGFDPTLFRGLLEQYGTMLYDASPEAQTQALNTVDQFIGDQESLIFAVEERNYSLDAEAASAIAWYGHNVPMRLATYFTVLLGSDVTEVFESETWQNIHETAVQNEFSPARVMGIDGTVLGVMADLFGGIAFDPTTWIFGPRATGGVSSLDHIAQTLRSPVWKKMTEQMVETFRSPFRSDSAMLAMGDDLASFGLYDELMARSLGVEGVETSRGWALIDGPEARATREVPSDRLLAMIPEDVVAQARARLAAGETVNNLDSQVVIDYNHMSQGVTMTVDDAMRLIAGQERGVGAAPVYGRVVESAIDPLRRQVIRDVISGEGNHVYHSSLGPIEGEFTGGGLSHRPLTRTGEVPEGVRQNVFAMNDVRAVLDENALRYFDNGGDIERIRPQGYVYPEGTSPRPNQPIATGPLPRPIGYYTPDEIASVRAGADEFRRLPTIGTNVLDDAVEGVFPLRDVFDDASLFPGMAEVMPAATAVMEKLLKRGGGNAYPMRTMLARGFAQGFRSHLQSGGRIGPWVTQWFSKQNISSWISTKGIGWSGDVRQGLTQMFGHDLPEMEFQLRRFREALRGDPATLTKIQAELRLAQQELAAFADNATGALNALDDVPVGVLDDIPPVTPDDVQVPGSTLADEAPLDDFEDAFDGANIVPEDYPVAAVVDEVPAIPAVLTEEAIARLAAKEAQRTVVMNLRKQLRTATLGQRKRAVEAAEKVIQSAWDDFNRRYIATHPFWKDLVDPETGMVPWDALGGGHVVPFESAGTTIPRSLADDIEKATGLDPNAVFNDLADLGGPGGIQMPLSPIDMIAASQLNGARWLQWKQARWGENLKNTANFMQRLWQIDKVFKVSTALTVNFDEMVRIFHIYGAPAIFQWLEDRLMFMSANVKRTNRVPGGGLRGVTGNSRAVFRNERWNKRMQTLQEYPEKYKLMENEYYEHFGDSWDDLAVDDPDWLPAMDRWTANLLKVDGFRASLLGPDEFARHWASAEAGAVRNQSVFDWGAGHTRIATMDEARSGYDFLLNEVFLGKVRPERRATVLQAMKDAARRLDAGEANVALAPNILREMKIPVRGVRNQAPKTSITGKISNAFFDNLFMSPTNYRRGFLAQLARKAETARLTRLYQSQRMRIIPDWQIDGDLGTLGIRANARFGISEAVEEELLARNIVPQSTITRLAERKAAAEMENLMYSWHQTSRAGRSAVNKGMFPFGRPYYDMWSFYARELFTRPALRGYLNNTNFANIGKIANSVVDRLPFNPKVPAMISRTAATDLGMGETDFSPLMFLPTEGDSAFMGIFPGLGLLPMWLGDWIISNLYDPEDDPEGYKRATDAVAAFVPAFGYQGTGLAARAFGGGALATAAKLGVDGYMMGTGNTWHEPLAMMGDIQSETQANRAMKALLADPEELELLLQMTEAELGPAFDALVGEAYAQGAGEHALDIGSRWMVPVDQDWSTTDDDVRQVWLDAGAQFPQLQSHRYNPNISDEFKDSQASDIQRAFYDLSDIEQDKLVVQFPQIAINLVSGWEWTKKAQDEFSDVALTPYGTGGIDIDAHQGYVRNDYIEPLPTGLILHRVIGTIFNARLNLAKALWTEEAEIVNTTIWDNFMPEAVKTWFESMAEEGIVDATDGRDVWRRWGTLEAEIEAVRGPQSLPEVLQSWGTSWEGLDDPNFSKKMRELTLDQFTDGVRESASILGIELEEGMTGEQLINQVQEVIGDAVTDSPLASFVFNKYDTFNQARSAAFTAGRNKLNETTGSGSEEYGEQVRDFLDYDARTRVLTAQDGSISVERSLEVRRLYGQLMTANPGINNFSWETIWRESFSRQYGDLDWAPPVPPVFDEVTVRNAYEPFLQEIVDGDTLTVSTEETASWLDLPGTRFDVEAAGTDPQKHQVRLLGLFAPEMSTDEGEAWRTQLLDAIMKARNEGLSITLVRDVDQAGSNTDYYGRELAWLFLGDEPYYFPETYVPGEY